jgi:hypothetical protein
MCQAAPLLSGCQNNANPKRRQVKAQMECFFSSLAQRLAANLGAAAMFSGA